MTSLSLAPVTAPVTTPVTVPVATPATAPAPDPGAAEAPQRELSAYLAAATRIAKAAAKRYDTIARTNGTIGSCDLASEGILAMREAEVAGRWPKSPSGFLKAVIASKAVSLGSSVSAEDRRAIRMLHALEAEEEARLGRLLTSGERDALATRIRESWEDRRHLPSVDFAAKVGADYTTSLDGPASDDQATTVADLLLHGQRAGEGLRVAPADEAAEETDLGEAMEEWLVASDKDSDEYDARRAWSLAYNAYAELTGAPAVARHLPESAAARARKRVVAAGGAGDLAERWWLGMLSDADEAALFAPLEEDVRADEEACRRFVDALLRRPGGAETVWDLAIRAATRRRG